MRCPFPGMDPYVERPENWPDFHDSLIAGIRGELQPQLRPRYVALTQDRIYVVESHRARRPDVSIIEAGPSQPRPRNGVAVLEADRPAVFEYAAEEVREPYLQIIEPAAGNRVVTALEVLSPDNKRPGAGRDSYLEKREELRAGGANLVEIDLLRDGRATVRLSPEKLDSLRPWHYLVAVDRISSCRMEAYPVLLQSRLPRVAIPLAAEDPDAVLDLQSAFTRCWDEGPYPELLGYESDPPGPMTDAERSWCRERAASLRAAAG